MKKVLIIGPAHPLRGGLATFNQRLALQFQNEGNDVAIISFSLQYPEALFPGTTQYSTDVAPRDIKIYSWINSINPLNWINAASQIRKLKADLIVVRFWLPFMGPALGTIIRTVKRGRNTRIVCIADNVIPHEKRFGDKPFTKYFLSSCDAFVTMSEKVLADLRSFEPSKPAQLVKHPLYDNFGEGIEKYKARDLIELPQNQKILLFFGFIRNYKGLDILLRAMANPKIREAGIKLLVAGEFYEDDAPYKKIIEEEGLEHSVYLHTSFIPDSKVRDYLCAADCVVQPYRNATQSGVTPLAYHFEKPMIVTNVGGLPQMVPHDKVGLVCEPEPISLANAIIEFYEKGEAFFLPNLREEKKKYEWSNLTTALKSL